MLSLRLVLQDSLEFKPDGHVSMLGKSLRGDYVFSIEGDLIKAGQSTSFYKVSPCQAAGSALYPTVYCQCGVLLVCICMLGTLGPARAGASSHTCVAHTAVFLLAGL